MKRFLNYSNSFLERLYHRIDSHTTVDADALACFRICFGLMMLFVFKTKLSWLKDIPEGFYRPYVLTLAKLFNSLPPDWFFTISDFLVVFLLLAITLGVKTRIISFVLFIIFIVNNSFAFSLGKIDHGILITMLLLFFSFSNAGTRLAIVPDRKLSDQHLLFPVYAILVVFGFFSAGYQKFFNWIDFDLSTSGLLSWFYNGYFSLERQDLLANFFFAVPLWVVETMEYFAVAFELSGLLFLLYSRKSWHIYLLIASIFHLLNTLILNIPFQGHFLVYGLWLISPFLKKHFFLVIIFPAIYLLDPLIASAILWTVTSVLALIGLKSGIYFRENTHPNLYFNFRIR